MRTLGSAPLARRPPASASLSPDVSPIAVVPGSSLRRGDRFAALAADPRAQTDVIVESMAMDHAQAEGLAHLEARTAVRPVSFIANSAGVEPMLFAKPEQVDL